MEFSWYSIDRTREEDKEKQNKILQNWIKEDSRMCLDEPIGQFRMERAQGCIRWYKNSTGYKKGRKPSTGIISTSRWYSGQHLAAEAGSFFPYKNDSGASAAIETGCLWIDVSSSEKIFPKKEKRWVRCTGKLYIQTTDETGVTNEISQAAPIIPNEEKVRPMIWKLS